MPRKKQKPDDHLPAKASYHEGLEGFDIKVNSFGQMESTFEIDKLNAFLNKEVVDKKLIHPEPPPKKSSKKKQ
jgi:hypothetical protein